MMWLLGSGVLFAEIPKANLSVTKVNNQQWPAQYLLTLEIPKDHHAYLDAGDDHIYIPIALDPQNKLTATGLAVTKFEKPAGVYDSLVKATVLRDKGEFNVGIQQGLTPLNSATTTLEVNYQICNEITHVCYRPQIAKVDINLPAAAPTSPAANKNLSSSTQSASLSDQILNLFKSNQDSLLIMFGLMFFAGIMSVATPCVYPMLPITSMFIVNRANGVAEKEKQHALAYLIGIIGTYMLLGLIAGMTGGAFNTFMQSAWVNLVFALFFAFFALALLGFYNLAFMQNEVYTLDQHSAQVKGLLGTWLMGSVAGLVISPCVGPIVFALLLQVADNIAAKADALAALNQSLSFWDKLGVASQGSLMMAGFGLGVGLPFFFVSVVKFKKLPKAGYWMNKIKYAFGLVILYFAYTYLEKAMGVLGAEHTTTLSLALGIVGIWIAVIHCGVLSLLPADAEPNQKLHHFVGVITLLIGAWLIIASLGQLPLLKVAQANNASQTTLASSEAKAGIEVEAGISWYRSFGAAQKVAAETHKPLFIDFYASWCANCVAFKAETAKNSALNQALRERAVAVKLVDKEPEFEAFRENPAHRQLKIGLPYFAILSAQGEVLWSGTDYTAAEQMIAVLDKLAAGQA